jgi:hypothetical protein
VQVITYSSTLPTVLETWNIMERKAALLAPEAAPLPEVEQAMLTPFAD